MIAFMMAMEQLTSYRLFPLPSFFNFRRASMHSRNGPTYPVMLHSHVFRNKLANVSNYKQIAIATSELLFEDCYQRMKYQAKGLHFDCNILEDKLFQ